MGPTCAVNLEQHPTNCLVKYYFTLREGRDTRLYTFTFGRITTHSYITLLEESLSRRGDHKCKENKNSILIAMILEWDFQQSHVDVMSKFTETFDVLYHLLQVNDNGSKKISTSLQYIHISLFCLSLATY